MRLRWPVRAPWRRSRRDLHPSLGDGVEESVLGPQRGSGVAGTAVDGGSVLGDELHDLDPVLEQADTFGQLFDGRGESFDIGHGIS